MIINVNAKIIISKAHFRFDTFEIIHIFAGTLIKTVMFNYYRIKTEWLAEKEDGKLQKTKTEELVYASSYTEAESIAYALVEKYERSRYGAPSIEIIKTKISELLYNSILQEADYLVGGLIINFFEEEDTTGVGMYQVKVYYTEVDEKTAKEKHSTETIFTPARSNSDASSAVLAYLKKVGETRDYVVRNSVFDKAEAILWPTEVYNNQVNKVA